LSGIDSGQIEPDIRFTHPAIYASDKVYAKQRHIRDNVGGVVRTLKAKLATSPARRRGGYDYQKAVLLRRNCRHALGIERGEPALDRGDDDREYGPRCRYTANSAVSRHKFLQSPRPPFLEFRNGDNFAYDRTDASDKLAVFEHRPIA
jgi:hypothetical protein